MSQINQFNTEVYIQHINYITNKSYHLGQPA